MKELNETEERTETRIEVALSYTNRVRLRDNQARFVMHNFNIIDEGKDSEIQKYEKYENALALSDSYMALGQLNMVTK
jgi:hypothetical protein